MSKIYILVMFCVLPFSLLKAQDKNMDSEIPDSVSLILPKVQKDTIKVDTTAYFNALDYTLQKRYKEPGLEFKNEKFFDNMYISLYGGVNKIVARGNRNFDMGPQFGIMIGKYLNPYNSLRLSVEGGKYDNVLNDKMKLSYWGVKADYLFNLTSYVNGYNPERFFEFSTVSGLGYKNTSLDNERKNAMDIHLGIQAKLRVQNKTDIFFEPYASFSTDGLDHSGKTNWHRYDLSYGAIMGLSYRFTSPEMKMKQEDVKFFDNTFVSASIGGQLLKSRLVKEMGYMQGLGPQINLSIGKWLIPMFGARLSGFGSFNKWRMDEKNERTAYGGGRLEGMISFASFFKNNNYDPKFDVVALAGLELGMMSKQYEPSNIKANYLGFTGALQLKYYVYNSVGFYIEPRISSIPYSVDEKDMYTDKVITKDYKDNLFSFNVGMEIRRTTSAKENPSRHTSYKPKYFVAVSGGSYTSLQMRRVLAKNHIGQLIGVSVGSHISPLSSLRVGVDYGKHSSGMQNRLIWYKSANFSLDYMLNLTNFLGGYDPERRIDARLFAGPLFTFQKKPKNNAQTAFGAELGANIGYRVIDNVDLFFEPKIRVLKGEYTAGITMKDYGMLMNFSLGAAYNFNTQNIRARNKSGLETKNESFWDNTFVSASLGGRFLLNNRTSDVSLPYSMGPHINFSFGKWFTPVLGARLTAFASINKWIVDTNGKERMGLGGGRLEGMLNIVPFFDYGYDDDRKFDISLIAGVEAGVAGKQIPGKSVQSNKYKYIGATGGLQAKYYVNSDVAIFIEPNASLIPLNLGTHREFDGFVGANFGLEIRRTLSAKDRSSQKNSFEPSFFASVSGGSYTSLQLRRVVGKGNIGSLGGISVGRNFSPISSLRVGADFGHASYGRAGNLKWMNSTNFVLDYMLNLTNFMAGYDPDRKVDVKLFAGPVFSMLRNAPENAIKKSSLGAEFGANISYNVWDNIDVFFEPKARVMHSALTAGATVHNMGLMMNFSLGATYRF